MDQMESVVVPCIYSVIAFLGIIGNGIVLYIMARVVKKKSVTDIYVTNLSLADFLFVATLPFWANELLRAEWIFGPVLCKLLSAISYINMYGSIFFLTAMGIDRWRAVVQAVKSRKTRTTRRAWITSALVWVVSLVFTIFPMLFRDIQPDARTGRLRCMWLFPKSRLLELNLIYNLSRTLVGFVIPLAIITFCYLNILIFMKNRSKQKRQSYKGLTRITKMVALIIVCFVLAWLPNQITNIIHFLKRATSTTYCSSSEPKSVNGTGSIDGSGDGGIPEYFMTTVISRTAHIRKPTANDIEDSNFVSPVVTSKFAFGAALEIAPTSDGYRLDLNPVNATAYSPIDLNTTVTDVASIFIESPCIRRIKNIHMIGVCLGFANSIMNPIIYALFGSSLRKKIGRMLSINGHRRAQIRKADKRTLMRTTTLTTVFKSTDGEIRSARNGKRSGGNSAAKKSPEPAPALHQPMTSRTTRFRSDEAPVEEPLLERLSSNQKKHILTNGEADQSDDDYPEILPYDSLFGGVWVGQSKRLRNATNSNVFAKPTSCLHRVPEVS